MGSMFAVPLVSSEQKGEEPLLLFKLLGKEVIHITSDHIRWTRTHRVASPKGKGGWGTWLLAGQLLSSNNSILRKEQPEFRRTIISAAGSNQLNTFSEKAGQSGIQNTCG